MNPCERSEATNADSFVQLPGALPDIVLQGLQTIEEGQ